MASTAQTTRKPAAKAPATTPSKTAAASTGPAALKRAHVLRLEQEAGAAHDALLRLPETAEASERERLKAISDLADAAVATAQRELAELVEHSRSLLGSSTLPALIQIGDLEVQLGTIVAAAHLASGLSFDAWNDAPQSERDRWLDAEITARRVASAPQPEVENQRGAWVTVIGPVKGRRRAGRGFSAAPQSFLASAEELAQLMADPLLAVTTGAAPGASAEAGRRLLVEEVSLGERGTIAVKVLGPVKGRRRAGFEFNSTAMTVEVDRERLALILGDPELAVLVA